MEVTHMPFNGKPLISTFDLGTGRVQFFSSNFFIYSASPFGRFGIVKVKMNLSSVLEKEKLKYGV
jgi:type IV secretory pathway TrbF-like protein